MSATVLIRLDGISDPLPVEDVSWTLVAPCGCTTGLLTVEHSSTDRDTAYRQMIPNAEVRRRRDGQGWRFEMATRTAACDRIRERCQHTPQYGVEPVAVPDGLVWAVDADQDDE